MSFATAGAIVGIASAGYSVYNSISKNAKAKRLARNNIRPVFKADGTIDRVYNLAGNELNDTRMEDYAREQLDQNAMSGIDAVLKSGGKLDFETAHNLYGKQLKGQVAQLLLNRDRKIADYNNAAYNLAASHDSEFSYNQDAPYKDNAQLEAVLKQEAANSARDAVNAVSSTVANYGISKAQPGRLKPDQRLPYSPEKLSYTASTGVPVRADARYPALGPSAGARAAAIPPASAYLEEDPYGLLYND